MTLRKPGSLRMIRFSLKTLGLSPSHPFYTAWVNIKTRCDNSRSTQYPWYGGRGIGYDERWKAFINFYNDMWDLWRPSLELDRIDTNLDYSKENCRWTTHKENCRNRRTTKLDQNKANEIRRLYYEERKTQEEIAKQFNVDQARISDVLTFKAWRSNAN